MNTPVFFIFCTLSIACAIGCLLALFFYFYRKFIIPMQTKRTILDTRFTFSELIESVDTIIAVECLIYEQYLQNTTDFSMTTITSAQFVNIYKDLSARILKGISKQFYECANVYMTTNELRTYVTQRVYNYLADKVKPGNESIDVRIQ